MSKSLNSYKQSFIALRSDVSLSQTCAAAAVKNSQGANTNFLCGFFYLCRTVLQYSSIPQLIGFLEFLFDIMSYQLLQIRFYRAQLWLVLWFIVTNRLLWAGLGGPDWWLPLWIAVVCSVKQVMMKGQQLLEETMSQRKRGIITCCLWAQTEFIGTDSWDVHCFLQAMSQLVRICHPFSEPNSSLGVCSQKWWHKVCFCSFMINLICRGRNARTSLFTSLPKIIVTLSQAETCLDESK